MPYKDLREWIAIVEDMGELSRLDGVHWRYEMGAISDISKNTVLFDNVPGYPKGYRVLMKIGASHNQFKLTWNFPDAPEGKELARALKNRLATFHPVPPRVVGSGPILENVDEGNKINVLKFPVPWFLEGDAGRYIGTQDVVMVRDPEEGWVDWGTFRVQVHDEKTLGLYISNGKKAGVIMQKYHARGEPCPVVVLVGQDPALREASSSHIPWGTSDLELAGWIRGEPVEVIKGKHTGLPIPARAEVAIEGEIPPGEMKMEGPFAEWSGYSDPKPMPIINIKAIYHQDNPIMTQSFTSLGLARPPLRARGDYVKGAWIWLELERAGVWGIECAASFTRAMHVVALKNLYGGHSTQAGLIASQCSNGAYASRYIVVIDHFLDPGDIRQVVWAILRYADPERSLHILRRCWSSYLDPAIPFEAKGYEIGGIHPIFNSRCVIDACRPVEWSKDVKKMADTNPEVVKRVKEKFGKQLVLK